jgi:hypothetical protein
MKQFRKLRCRCGKFGAVWIEQAVRRAWESTVDGKVTGSFTALNKFSSFWGAEQSIYIPPLTWGQKHIQFPNQKKTNSAALSPQANYTDWATATCRRSLVPTFVDRGVSRGQRGGSPTVVNVSFLDRSRYFSFKYLLIYPHKGWVDPVPDPLLLRKSCSAGNPTWDLWVSSQEVWPLDHRGGYQFPKRHVF